MNNVIFKQTIFKSALFFLFGTLLLQSCLAMEAPKPESEFEKTCAKFARRVKDYNDYADDAIEYFESLKRHFDSQNSKNIDNYNDNLKKLSDHDQKMCESRVTELLKDNAFKDIEKSLLKMVLTIISMEFMVDYFNQKISILNLSKLNYNRVLNTLSSENINLVFLSQVTNYAFYIKSRCETIKNDPSPVFSCLAKQYPEYEKRKIENEITKHELLLSFLKSFRPFVDNDNKRLKELLAYLPILSTFLQNPKVTIEFDDFCLDGFNMASHGADHKKIDESTNEKDIRFIENTRLPLLDINTLRPIKDPTFKENREAWQQIYKGKLQVFSLQTPSKTTVINSTPQQTVLASKTPVPSTPKKKKRQPKRKQNLQPKTPVSMKKTNFEAKTPKNSQPKAVDQKIEQQEAKLNTPANNNNSMPIPQTSQSQLSQHESSVKSGPEENKTTDKKESISTPTETIDSIKKDFEGDVPPHSDAVSPPTKGNIEVKRHPKSLSEIGCFNQAGHQTRKEKKAGKNQQKALLRKQDFQLHQSLIGSDAQIDRHPPLPTGFIFTLHSTDYTIIHNLLTNKLSPNTRYEDIISSLNTIGIVTARSGHGDYRKIYLPNGHKIFVYRPATPHVGNRFLKKLREELPSKWGLKIEHLRRK